jgi:hypothetical protein
LFDGLKDEDLFKFLQENKEVRALVAGAMSQQEEAPQDDAKPDTKLPSNLPQKQKQDFDSTG